jgi:uncharacterized protein YodC (DUF2158 family)
LEEILFVPRNDGGTTRRVGIVDCGWMIGEGSIPCGYKFRYAYRKKKTNGRDGNWGLRVQIIELKIGNLKRRWFGGYGQGRGGFEHAPILELMF